MSINSVALLCGLNGVKVDILSRKIRNQKSMPIVQSVYYSCESVVMYFGTLMLSVPAEIEINMVMLSAIAHKGR